MIESTMFDTILFKMIDNHVHCSIYTANWKNYILINYQDSIYYFDNDDVGNIIYDTNLIKFTSEILSSGDNFHIF